MTREIDTREYIKRVVMANRTAGIDCRSAVAFMQKKPAGPAICMQGFVIDRQYFIQRDTYKIFPKSDFYLINYDDEMMDNE